MRSFRRVRGGFEAHLEEFEVALLSSLAEQLRELLGGSVDIVESRPMDAFERLVADQLDAIELDHSDPLIERLFPAAYTDASRADEFRRYTEEESRRARVAHASVVLEDLSATREGEEPLRVGPEHVDAWLKTVNALRLSLSVRLGIVDEASLDLLERLPARDPRTQLMDLYDWLGFVLESLLEALES